jgi:CDP-glucose 4,6-dehydratase
MPIFIARCGNIYGPGDTNWSRIVPGTFKSLYSGEVPILRSDGSFTRDYIFVGDVVNAYLTLAKNSKTIAPGSAYNFSHDSACSVFEIYASICEAATGKYVKPVILDVASHEIHDQHLSSLKAKNDLRWKAFISLDEGLNLSASWYQNIFQKEF